MNRNINANLYPHSFSPKTPTTELVNHVHSTSSQSFEDFCISNWQINFTSVYSTLFAVLLGLMCFHTFSNRAAVNSSYTIYIEIYIYTMPVYAQDISSALTHLNLPLNASKMLFHPQKIREKQP